MISVKLYQRYVMKLCQKTRCRVAVTTHDEATTVDAEGSVTLAYKARNGCSDQVIDSFRGSVGTLERHVGHSEANMHMCLMEEGAIAVSGSQV